MDDTKIDLIEAAFRDWWQESYKRPPNAQAIMTHVAFAKHILALLELTQDVQTP
jgi:hypothetical protein